MTFVDPTALRADALAAIEEQRAKAHANLAGYDKTYQTDAAALRAQLKALFNQLLAAGYPPEEALTLARQQVNDTVATARAEGQADLRSQYANQAGLGNRLDQVFAADMAARKADLDEIAAAGRSKLENTYLQLMAEGAGGGGGGGRGGGGRGGRGRGGGGGFNLGDSEEKALVNAINPPLAGLDPRAAINRRFEQGLPSQTDKQRQAVADIVRFRTYGGDREQNLDGSPGRRRGAVINGVGYAPGRGHLKPGGQNYAETMRTLTQDLKSYRLGPDQKPNTGDERKLGTTIGTVKRIFGDTFEDYSPNFHKGVSDWHENRGWAQIIADREGFDPQLPSKRDTYAGLGAGQQLSTPKSWQDFRGEELLGEQVAKLVNLQKRYAGTSQKYLDQNENDYGINPQGRGRAAVRKTQRNDSPLGRGVRGASSALYKPTFGGVNSDDALAAAQRGAENTRAEAIRLQRRREDEARMAAAAARPQRVGGGPAQAPGAPGIVGQLLDLRNQVNTRASGKGRGVAKHTMGRGGK